MLAFNLHFPKHCHSNKSPTIVGCRPGVCFAFQYCSKLDTTPTARGLSLAGNRQHNSDDEAEPLPLWHFTGLTAFLTPCWSCVFLSIKTLQWALYDGHQ